MEHAAGGPHRHFARGRRFRGCARRDRIRVVSRHGAAVAPAHISAAVRAGQLFATFHTSEVFLNAVTGPNRDSAGTPEYKVTAVRIERMPRE